MTIRQSPADFLVEELLAPSVARQVRDRPAAFALYRLTKENLTTPDAIAAAAKSLGLRPGQIAYAGLKDRHARTVQHVAASLVRAGLHRSAGGAPAPSGEWPPASAQGPGWRIERIGWLDDPLTAEAIHANRFRITVRDLGDDACRRMDEAVRLLTCGAGQHHPSLPQARIVFVNYFGDQRFGSARHGRGFLARHLVRGEFEEALRLAIATWARKDGRRQKDFKRAAAKDWGNWPDLAANLPPCPQRRAVEHLAASPGDFCGAFAALPYGFQELAVHAYQSHLWNATARRLVGRRCTGPVLAAADPFGEMLFPAAAGIPADLRDLELPLLGRGSELRGPWKTSAQAVLQEEGITTDRLRIPGLRRPRFAEVPRRLFVEAASFSLSPSEPEVPQGKRPPRLTRTVAFELPRGSYATVVLRALGQ
jgi:tRNA pseudouridine13 synthase